MVVRKLSHLMRVACPTALARLPGIKILTVRLPDPLMSEIEAESRRRKCAKSGIVRERLQHARIAGRDSAAIDAISDLIGSVDGLPADLSARKKRYLKATRYGA